MRTFIGFEGQYDIYDSGSVVLKIADEDGKINGKVKKFSNPKHISNNADRNGVLHLLQLMRIYKTLGQTIRQY